MIYTISVASLLGRTVASNAESNEIDSRSFQWLPIINTTEISNFGVPTFLLITLKTLRGLECTS